jgi:hypothetical protein
MVGTELCAERHSHMAFPLRAADPDEKWARVGSHDGSKYRPVMVPHLTWH